MKKSISQVIGKRKSFDAKYFTRSPTMPALSYRANPHVSVDPMDDDKTDAIKDQRANLKDKRFRSAVSGCLYCSILESLLMLYRYVYHYLNYFRNKSTVFLDTNNIQSSTLNP